MFVAQVSLGVTLCRSNRRVEQIEIGSYSKVRERLHYAAQ